MMSDLPNREEARSLVDSQEIFWAWREGELRTDAEWREAIDYEAMRAEWDECTRTGVSLPDALVRVVDAALGVDHE
jgi:hypothetical protein